MPYILNNIEYRNVSSKAIEFYYATKSYILNELTIKDNGFSETARELMLLFFNNYSRWAISIETLLLDRDKVTEEDIQIILNRYGDVVQMNKLVLDTHPHIFKKEFLDVWKPNHKHIPNLFKLSIRDVQGLSQMDGYPMIMNALINALYSTLYEIREIDCLLGSNLVEKSVTSNQSSVDNLLTYVDESMIQYYNLTGINPIAERIKLYKTFVVADPLPVVIKNHAQQRIVIKEKRLQGVPTMVAFVDEIISIPGVEVKSINI